MFEKKELFSIRKLRYGVASVLIAAFLSGGQQVAAETSVSQVQQEVGQATIPVHYLNYQALTAAEREALVYEVLPADKALAHQVAFLVYQPKARGHLPVTGEQASLLSLALAAGGVLIAVYALRKGKKQLLAVFVIAGMVPLDAAAHQDLLRTIFSASLSVQVGDFLAPEIEGYTYLGYLDQGGLTGEGALASALTQLAPAVDKTQQSPLLGQEEGLTRQTWAVPQQLLVNEEAPIAEEIVAPVSPSAPVEPVPSELDVAPVSPSEPVEPIPTEPDVAPVSPSAPVEPIPTEPDVVPVSPSDPVEPIPTEPDVAPVSPSEPVEPVPTVPDVAPVSPSEPVEPVPSEPDAVPVSPSEPVEPVPTVPDVAPVSPTEPVVPVEEVRTSTVSTLLPFEEEVRLDPTLWEDEQVEEVAGQQGLVETRTHTRYLDGQAQSDPVVEQVEISPVVNRIIRKGTKPLTRTETTTSEQVIPYSREVEEDSSLWLGEEQVDQQGKEGKKRLITTTIYIKDQAQSDPRIVEEVVEPAISERVRRGTKPHEEVREVRGEERPIPFAEQVEDDATLWEGESRIERPGEEGRSVTITRSHYVKGLVVGEPQVDTQTLVEPVTQLKKRGTKPRLTPTLAITHFNDQAADNRPVLRDRDLSKQVAVTFTTTHPEAVTATRYRLLKEDQEVATGSVHDSLSLTNLKHDVPYRLEMSLDYDTPEGAQTITSSKEFVLELKKIEIKDVKEYRLFKRENDRNVRINSLSTLPGHADWSNYYVEVVSDTNKTMVLPVTAMEEAGDGFRISLETEDLIERREGLYERGHDLIYPKTKQITKTNGVSTFADLIQALNDQKGNPQAVIELLADVSATEVAVPAALTYVTDKFLGTFNGNGFTISDTVRPLFNILEGAKINSVVIKDADILQVEENAGILATSIEKNSQVTGLDVSGRVAGLTSVGGVTGVLKDSSLTDVTVQAAISRTQNIPNYYRKPYNNKAFGGLVGHAFGRVQVDKAYLDVDVQSNYGSPNGWTGGVFGRLESGANGEVKNVYVTGRVEAIAAVGRTGGFVGSGWNTSTNNHHIIAAVDAKNGNVLRSENGNFSGNIFLVDGKAKGIATNVTTTTISPEAAKEKLAEFGIRTPEAKVYQHKQTYNQPLLHHNMEKFLPFYNVSYIEKQAKLLANTPDFAQKKVLSVLPTNGNEIVSDYTGQTPITGILVHFEDGSLARYGATFKEDFNGQLKEYSIPDLGIVYTPEGFIADQGLVGEIAEILRSVDTSSYIQIDLEDQVQTLKGNMETVVTKLLSTDKSYAFSSPVIREELKNRVRENKDDLLKGLAYLSRWYGIQFDDFNSGDLLTYNQRFFGKNAPVLSTMIDLGRISRPTTTTWHHHGAPHVDATGSSELKMAFSDSVFKHLLADKLGTDNLMTFLESMKNKFTNHQSMEDWFKATTKAYIQEGTIGDADQLSSIGKTYARLSRPGSELNPYILPLLTAKEGIYMIVSPAAISVGMAEKYLDLSLKETNPEAFKEKLAVFKDQLKRQSDHYHNHYTFWYNQINDKAKKDLERDLLSVDNYNLKGSWRNLNSKNQAMKDFFSPMQLLFGNGNKSSAYADGSRTNFVIVDQLSDYGSAVYSHEMVHNNDGRIYFNNGGRRNNIGAEYFATGMFQVPDPDKLSWDSLGLNNMYDYTNHKDKASPTRTQNLSPDRISTPEKLHSFMKRSFDVLYTLDYAEAEEMLKRPYKDKKKWYAVIDTVAASNSQNIRRELPDGLQLESLNDLIQQEIISKNGYGLGDLDIFGQKGANKYYYIRLFEPIYATGENKNGAAGDIMFRRMAFELLAYKGYTEGMLPYISNGLNKQKPKDKKVVTDDFVIQTVSNNTYQSMAEFKRAMFEERYAKKDRLKPVTITWNKKEVTIDSYEKIKELMSESLSQDLQGNGRQTKLLKNLIYSAYLKLTDDFRLYNFCSG